MSFIKVFLASLMVVLVLTHSTFAALGDLDLKKFLTQANQKLEKLYGPGNLEKDIAIYFQDGAGVGAPEILDFSTITLVRKPKFVTEHELIQRVGYRLAMNGELRIVNVHFGECALHFSIMERF